GRARPKTAQALEAAAEREALVRRRVVADAAQHVGVHHPAARGFDPAIAAARVALRIAPLADEAAERDLRGRLGEREVVDAEADATVAPKYLPCERIQDRSEEHTSELQSR